MSIIRPSFETSLIRLLEDRLLNKMPLKISWTCKKCGEWHSGDLLKKAKTVAHNGLTVSSYDEENNPTVTIKVSKNKKVVHELADYARKKEIIYVQVKDLGVKKVLEMVTEPFFVDFCMNPKCKKCGGFQKNKSMMIINGCCWKCKDSMKVAMLDCHGYRPGPEVFSANELAFARESGVNIQSNFSYTVGESYLSNTCLHCGAFDGRFYLFTNYFIPAQQGEYSYEIHPMGNYCEDCLLHNKNED